MFLQIETKTAKLPILDGLFGGEACVRPDGKYITKWPENGGIEITITNFLNVLFTL